MRVLVVGSGGREHALVWKLSQSRRVAEILVAPGNAGTAALAENVPISTTDIAALVELALHRRVDLVVVGPEVPLALGLVDALQQVGVSGFGPTMAAARLEASKAFAHEVMQRCGVPCARSAVFTTVGPAREFALSLEPPFVVKADGLAAGKGAVIVGSQRDAETTLVDMLERRVFGAAGERVVIEEYLTGREVSLLAFTDGKQVVPMVPSCDYKRACDHDEGPNTGGMGCYSPPGFFDQDMVVRATECAVRPVIRQLAEDGVVYRGVVYAGLMVDGDDIKVLEFNARFGDPETQVVLPRLESDLAEVMLACVEDRLDPASVQWKPGCAVAVVLASGGYPGLYSKGYPILGLDRVDRDVNVFHAGTCMDRDGEIVTDGGRVLAVVSAGASIAEARERVYTNVARLSFTDMMYRTDIALREVA